MKPEVTLSIDELALVERAHQRLLGMLAGHGNLISDAHSTALADLLWLMTAKAVGKLGGRHVAPLPTGSGKTTAIIAWVTELVLTWDEEIPVCVSMFTVEALCRLYRALLDAGLNGDQVGLIHSLGDNAPEPSLKRDGNTREYPYRQVMLVSHNRLRDGDLDQFFFVGGLPRALTIFDESLVTSQTTVIDATTLHAAQGAISKVASELGLTDLVRYLSAFSGWYESAPIGQTDEAVTFQFPMLSASVLKVLFDQSRAFERQVSGSAKFRDAIQASFRCSGQVGRLTRDGKTKLVFPEPNFPDELDEVLVLDASYLMKIAERYDASMTSGEDALQGARPHHVNLSSFKRYDNVTVKVLPVSSGRTSIRGDLKSGHGAILEEVVECVRQVPPRENVLVVTFKDLGLKGQSGVDYLTDQLRRAGIDVEQQAVAATPDRRRRINVLTWGQEASLNDFSHCEHVILYGLHFRDSADLAGLYFGARRDINVRYGSRQLKAHSQAEAAQSALQALSRGTCRSMVDGQALPMTGYIMTKDKTVLEYLSALMPGVRFDEWPAVGLHTQVERDQEVLRIRELMTKHFDDQSAAGQEMRITGVQLRKLIDPDKKKTDSTRKRLIAAAMEGMFTWRKDDRSYAAFNLSEIAPLEFMVQAPKEDL